MAHGMGDAKNNSISNNVDGMDRKWLSNGMQEL